MNLWDAFKIGGLPGAAAQIGAQASPAISKETANAVFAGGASDSRALFNLGFSDKLLLTLLAGTVFVVVTARAVR